MKLEVRYEIKEITRYVIWRHEDLDSPEIISRGVGFGNGCGEFEDRRDAERVRDALEADIGRQIRKVI